MGTTLKDAGSKENQFLVDYTYQYEFAKIAAENGVSNYSLVSAQGANSSSSFFYPKIKGELEESIKKLNFKLGAHFHNNCGLAIANSLAAIDNNCTVVDSTFTGMGRGAGNAETEMLIATKTKIKPKISSFDINNLIEKFELINLSLKTEHVFESIIKFLPLKLSSKFSSKTQ